MNFSLKIWCFVFLFDRVVADPYNCAATETINPPASLNTVWYYPSTWNTSIPAPQYVAGQNCSWIVNVPKGMYAYFAIKANTNQPQVLTMTDSVGYVTTIQSASLEPFFVMDPSFRVDLQAYQTGTLGMLVQWFPISPVFPTTWPVHSKSSPLSLFDGDYDNSTVIRSSSRVSLLVIPPIDVIFTPYLRLIQVFDGPSTDSVHIGNLYQILSSGYSYVSTGNSLTLFSLHSRVQTRSTVIIQDYSDVQQFKTYKAITCFLPNTCQTSLDARDGTAAAIRYNPTPSQPFYVKSLAMPDGNKLSVYTDYLTDSHKLADYTSTTAEKSIPQKYSGTFTTFVLDQYHATVQFSSNIIDAKWTTGFDGREGFFASPNYGIRCSDQKLSDKIFASSISEISYSFDTSSLVGDATLNVVIGLGQKAVINNTYSSSNLMGGLVKSTGDNIAVEYQSNGATSTGAFVNFYFERHNSAALCEIYLSIILSIWMTFFNR